MFSKAYVHYVFQNTVKCSLIVNHIKWRTLIRVAVIKSQVFVVGLLDRHKFQVTDDFPRHRTRAYGKTYVNVSR